MYFVVVHICQSSTFSLQKNRWFAVKSHKNSQQPNSGPPRCGLTVTMVSRCNLFNMAVNLTVKYIDLSREIMRNLCHICQHLEDSWVVQC